MVIFFFKLFYNDDQRAIIVPKYEFVAVLYKKNKATCGGSDIATKVVGGRVAILIQ